MCSLQIYMLFLITSGISGEELCSDGNRKIKCVPCTEICLSIITCDKVTRCPKQCGDSRTGDICSEVCNSRCLNGKCEYDGGQLKCSEGCSDGWAGSYCQQRCKSGCRKCNQLNLTCISRDDSFDGDNYLHEVTRILTSVRSVGYDEKSTTPQITTVTQDHIGKVKADMTPTILVSGIVAGGVITLVIVGICYTFKRLIPKCIQRNTNNSLIPVDANYGYTYIEDTDLVTFQCRINLPDAISVQSTYYSRIGDDGHDVSTDKSNSFSQQVMRNVDVLVHRNTFDPRRTNPTSVPQGNFCNVSQSVPLGNPSSNYELYLRPLMYEKRARSCSF